MLANNQPWVDTQLPMRSALPSVPGGLAVDSSCVRNARFLAIFTVFFARFLCFFPYVSRAFPLHSPYVFFSRLSVLLMRPLCIPSRFAFSVPNPGLIQDTQPRVDTVRFLVLVRSPMTSLSLPCALPFPVRPTIHSPANPIAFSCCPVPT